MLASRGGFSVINVDYRLAPENKFPAAVEDAWAAFEWAKNGAAGLAIDMEKLALAGDSAGGNLSAVVAVMARDAGINLSFQALIYPATKLYFNTNSHQLYSTGYLLTKDAQNWYHDQYLRSDEDRDDWRVSPAFVEDLTGVASAYVLTC